LSSPKIGFPDFHVHDTAARGFEFPRARQQLHHMKRRYFGDTPRQ